MDSNLYNSGEQRTVVKTRLSLRPGSIPTGIVSRVSSRGGFDTAGSFGEALLVEMRRLAEVTPPRQSPNSVPSSGARSLSDGGKDASCVRKRIPLGHSDRAHDPTPPPGDATMTIEHDRGMSYADAANHLEQGQTHVSR